MNLNVTKIIRNIWTKKPDAAQKVASNIANATPPRMTKVMTDSATGIVRMEREITRNGERAIAKIETLPNGVTKTTITGGGDNDLWRTKEIIREKNGSIFGGDKITINKDETKYWCYGEKNTLVKDYNPSGILEHKELTKKVSQVNGEFKAVQDRVYNESLISSSADEMLPANLRRIRDSKKTPITHQNLLEQSDNKYSYNNTLQGRNYSENNYYKFADRAETNYTRAIIAKEQAAKKAEEAIIATKLAAEKAAAELKAIQPRMNIGKILNTSTDDLLIKETKLPNGFTERVYTAPNSDKILIKTQDMKNIHKEWIYPNNSKADMIYMKQVGNDSPYIVSKKGNYTQVNDRQYYTDGINSYSNSKGSCVNDCAILRKPYKETSSYKNSSSEMKEIYDNEMLKDNKTHWILPEYVTNSCATVPNTYYREVTDFKNVANQSYINLTDLLSAYKA